MLSSSSTAGLNTKSIFTVTLSCTQPQISVQAHAALVKTYYAQQQQIEPEQIFNRINHPFTQKN
jgi:hypothetical protein